mgnify:CR=1 FL=1
MDNNEFIAVKEFANGLTEAIQHKIHNSNIEEEEIVLHNMLSLISLHLNIAEIEFNAETERMAKAMEEK